MSCSGWSLDFGGGAGGVVTASGETDTTVDLAWSGASDDVGVVDYNVYQNGAPVQTGVVGTSTTVTGLTADSTYTFTIQARDAALNVSTDGPSVVATTEPGAPGPPVVSVTATDGAEAGSVDGVFTVSRTGPTTAALSVAVDLAGSTATAPPDANQDYTNPVPNPVVIPAGQASQQVLVDPVDDTVDEPNETVNVAIVADPAYVIGSPASATVTIVDDDDVPPPGFDVILDVGDDFQAAVDANPAGTSFFIRSGIHRMQSVMPKADMMFVGEPGAILNGSRVLTGWVQDGSRWYVTGQTQESAALIGDCDRRV